MIGLETAFAAVYTGLVEPGVVPLSTVVDADDGRPGAGLRAARAAARGRGARRPRALGSVRELDGRADRTPPASRNCAFAGRTLQGRCTITIAGGTVAHRLAEVAR